MKRIVFDGVTPVVHSNASVTAVGSTAAMSASLTVRGASPAAAESARPAAAATIAVIAAPR
jgi:hypothetical protein